MPLIPSSRSPSFSKPLLNRHKPWVTSECWSWAEPAARGRSNSRPGNDIYMCSGFDATTFMRLGSSRPGDIQ